MDNPLAAVFMGESAKPIPVAEAAPTLEAAPTIETAPALESAPTIEAAPLAPAPLVPVEAATEAAPAKPDEPQPDEEKETPTDAVSDVEKAYAELIAMYSSNTEAPQAESEQTATPADPNLAEDEQQSRIEAAKTAQDLANQDPLLALYSEAHQRLKAQDLDESAIRSALSRLLTDPMGTLDELDKAQKLTSDPQALLKAAKPILVREMRREGIQKDPDIQAQLERGDISEEAAVQAMTARVNAEIEKEEADAKIERLQRDQAHERRKQILNLTNIFYETNIKPLAHSDAIGKLVATGIEKEIRSRGGHENITPAEVPTIAQRALLEAVTMVNAISTAAKAEVVVTQPSVRPKPDDTSSPTAPRTEAEIAYQELVAGV